MLFLAISPLSSSSPPPVATASCRDIKSAYQSSSCCGASLDMVTDYMVEAPPPPPMAMGNNYCAGTKLYSSGNTPGFPDLPQPYFHNTNCTLESGVVAVAEQSGTNVTAGYTGNMAGLGTPISTPYYEAGLCPVNVHWHLGAEHLSVGEFDEYGSGPSHMAGLGEHGRRMSSGAVRQGFFCHHYDAMDPQFTTPYDWKYCQGMEVGATYEIHWPHSAAGACGTPFQYQTPFYDGVFCRGGIISLSPLNTFSTIGVQGQVFTIVNNESYYYPDLMRGMIVDGEYGADVAYYSGSTTGTSRDNTICSRYTPITWQVDRKCHLISASTFDKMCKDMMAQYDDMSGDLHAHGARELVLDDYAANNHADMAYAGRRQQEQ